MNNSPAFMEIANTYDTETMQEIVNHGCQSGVCSQHIHYADTIAFFDTYEDEITNDIIDIYGTDFLTNIFRENDCVLDMYKNDVVWCFIESVASIVLTTLEEEQLAQDEQIASYIEPKDSHLFYTSKDGELMDRVLA